MKHPLVAVCLSMLGVAAAAQAPPVLFQKPMSPRNANYAIVATLDAKEHSVKGTERVRWRNIQPVEASEAKFHLYLNAFANDRTVFFKESGGQLRGDKADMKNWGYCLVSSIAQVVDGQPVPLKQEFPGEDRTVMRVALARPVPPGADAEFAVTFESKLPKVFARSGYAGDFHMVGQWFPKLGVWQGEKGWNCHAYHANSEFFSDFGVYDVDVTVPKNFVVGATGVQWSEQSKGDSKTLRFHAEDVHDFGWTASPKFLDRTETFDGIKVRVLMQPGNAGHIGRYMEAARHTIECYAKWIWKYPYPQMTIVDPPTDGMGAAGMEYPMLITGGTSPFIPKALLMAEMVVVHEFGHNYWYGMEANNEFEEAWLDEGINSYYEGRIMDEAYGPKTSILEGLLGWHLGDFQMQRIQYTAIPDMDPMVQDSWKYSSNGSYSVISYSKSALVLKTLEGLLGQKKMDEVMKTFFDEVKFTHPTTEDFLRIVSRAAGRDLDPVLRPLIYGTGTVDFKVARVKNERRSEPEGYDLLKAPPTLMVVSKKDKKDKGKPKDAKGTYDSTVTVQRKGDLVLPVEVRVTFADKTSKVESWDGQGRYKVWIYGGPKVTQVEVDPEGKIPLDLQRLNNGWSAEGDAGGASSLVSRFRAVFQTLFAVSIGLF